MAKARKLKVPAFKSHTSYRTTKRYGILNNTGGIWTPETFSTPERAQKYLDDERAHWPGSGLRKHKVVRVRVTVSVIAR